MSQLADDVSQNTAVLLFEDKNKKNTTCVFFKTLSRSLLKKTQPQSARSLGGLIISSLGRGERAHYIMILLNNNIISAAAFSAVAIIIHRVL